MFLVEIPTFGPQSQTSDNFPGLYSHAAARRNLASISVPGDLRLGEAADARRRNHRAVSLGDRLDSFALLETSHNCTKTKTGGARETGRCGFLLQEFALFLEQQSAAGRCHGTHRGPALVNLYRLQPIYSSPASLYLRSRQESALTVPSARH